MQQKNTKPQGSTNSFTPNYFDMKKNSNYVSYLFRQKTMELAHTTRVVKPGTKLYELQTEFSYMLHEMQKGFVYRRQAMYAAIIDFIEKIDITAK